MRKRSTTVRNLRTQNFEKTIATELKKPEMRIATILLLNYHELRQHCSPDPCERDLCVSFFFFLVFFFFWLVKLKFPFQSVANIVLNSGRWKRSSPTPPLYLVLIFCIQTSFEIGRFSLVWCPHLVSESRRHTITHRVRGLHWNLLHFTRFIELWQFDYRPCE